MIWRVLIRALVVLLVVIVQISFMPALPWPLSLFMPVLLLVLLVGLLKNFKEGYIYAIACGALLDLYTAQWFMTTALVLVVILWLIDRTVHRFFATTTVYSVILMVGLAACLYFVAQYTIFQWVYHLTLFEAPQQSPHSLPLVLGALVGLHMIAAMIMYVIAYYASNKFHASILRS